ncbi:porin [Usitatibacter palustris]|uniref:Outer membrane porin protein 32 n=1 Tax=Usitatibacter palustris TaxID=2732487 RepID=A0A6M4H8J7_9PROT|nr:porin [Usitatibacter palustris]QJR15920.1 Outer membrane porin protein 32 [Usitatibacter palustris]
MKARCLAALAAAALPCAAQEATESPMTLYGRVYLMVDSVEAKGGTTPLARRTRVTDQSSLLGVRGEEKLSSELKAIYQLETGFPPDQQTANFANRNSGVGLAHAKLGTIIMGRWDMPFKSSQVAPLDPFTDLALADVTGTAMNQGNFSLREQNVIQYWSPNWAGLEVRLAYSANEGKTADRDPYKYGGSLVWTNRTVYLTYAYEKHNDSRDGTVTAGIEEEGHGVGGYVRLGGAKLMAQYGTYSRTGTAKQKSYVLGVDWVFGERHHLLASYQDSRDGGVTTAAQPRCDAQGLGYRYDFSRRTMFTAYYTKVNNDVGNLCNFGAATLSITAGQDPQGFSAGVRHTF